MEPRQEPSRSAADDPRGGGAPSRGAPARSPTKNKRGGPEAAPLALVLGGTSELRGDLRLLVQLEHGLAVLPGADANRLLHRQHEDLAVADLARAGVPQDRLDDEVFVFVLDHDLQLDLRPDVDGEGRAAVT